MGNMVCMKLKNSKIKESLDIDMHVLMLEQDNWKEQDYESDAHSHGQGRCHYLLLKTMALHWQPQSLYINFVSYGACSVAMWTNGQYWMLTHYQIKKTFSLRFWVFNFIKCLNYGLYAASLEIDFDRAWISHVFNNIVDFRQIWSPTTYLF